MSVFVWKDPAGDIISFSNTPWVLGAGETEDEVPGTMDDYARRCYITSDKATLQSDGLDTAVIQVATNIDPFPAAIGIDAGGTTVTVTMVATPESNTSTAIGSFNLVADEPGLVLIVPEDKSTYAPAGNGFITVEAVE